MACNDNTWESEHSLVKDIQWLTLVRNLMMQRRDTPHMMLNFMQWCKHSSIGSIISLIENLLYILIMKLCGTLIPKRNLTIDMQNFLEQFTFNLKHQAGIQNKVANALSRKAFILVNMFATTIGLEDLKSCYNNDADFGTLYLYSCWFIRSTC